MDMAIFAEAEDCVMDMGDTHIDVSHEGTIVTEKTCCTDVVDLFEGQDELTIETTKVFKIDQQIFILSFAAVFSGLNLFEFQKDHPLERYNPPLCTKDIQVVNQVFLI